MEPTTIDAINILKDLKYTEPFTRQQLHAALSSVGRKLSYNSMGDAVLRLMKAGIVERVGRNLYVATQSKRSKYTPIVSEQLSLVIGTIRDSFPLVEFSAWETTMLNEFLNHQIAGATILIEVEAMLEHAVFKRLRQELNTVVLFKPDQKTFTTYWEPDCIVVQRLATQAPVSRKDDHLPVLEKIIVDLFANKLLSSLFSSGELPSMLEQMFERYSIDESRLFRYAQRRNCAEKIKVFIKDKTNIILRSR